MTWRTLGLDRWVLDAYGANSRPAEPQPGSAGSPPHPNWHQVFAPSVAQPDRAGAPATAEGRAHAADWRINEPAHGYFTPAKLLAMTAIDLPLGRCRAGSAATGGIEVLIGIAAIVLGILLLIMAGSSVLVLIGLLAAGAALLLVNATFSGAMLHMLIR
jgi:hypothetical protein